ncbi:unnamed protein product [Hanseniaspora opuntiae]
MKSWLLLFTLIANISCTGVGLNKRDIVTTSIATFLTTQPGGNVVTIQTPTVITIADAATTTSSSSSTTSSVTSTTSSVTSTTSSSSSTTVNAVAAAAAVTTTSSSSSSSGTSTTTTAVAAAADTTTAVDTKGVGVVTTGNFLGVAKSTTTTKASGSGTETASTDVYTGPRLNPSTSITPLPSTPVTTLTIESYETITMKHTTYTTTRAKTSMYVTLTVQSMVEVIQTTFAQRFKTMYSNTFGGSSGSVGLGTLSGEVGKVKASYTYTQEGSNDAMINTSNWSLLGMLLSALYMFI